MQSEGFYIQGCGTGGLGAGCSPAACLSHETVQIASETSPLRACLSSPAVLPEDDECDREEGLKSVQSREIAALSKKQNDSKRD